MNKLDFAQSLEIMANEPTRDVVLTKEQARDCANVLRAFYTPARPERNAYELRLWIGTEMMQHGRTDQEQYGSDGRYYWRWYPENYLAPVVRNQPLLSVVDSGSEHPQMVLYLQGQEALDCIALAERTALLAIIPLSLNSSVEMTLTADGVEYMLDYYARQRMVATSPAEYCAVHFPGFNAGHMIRMTFEQTLAVFGPSMGGLMPAPPFSQCQIRFPKQEISE